MVEFKNPYFDGTYQVAEFKAQEFIEGIASEGFQADLLLLDPGVLNGEKPPEAMHEPIGPVEMMDLLKSCFNVLRKGGHAYILCEQHEMMSYIEEAEEIGFDVVKILYYEGQSNRDKAYPDHLKPIIFMTRGLRPKALTDKTLEHFLRYPKSSVRPDYHEAKPVELFETLITQSTGPGDFVFDPFCGSGAAGVAAVKNQRFYLGCDHESTAIALAEKKLEELEASLRGFWKAGE